MKDTTFFWDILYFVQLDMSWKRARGETANNWRLSESSRSITSLHFSCGCQFLRLWKVHWNQTEPYLARGHLEEHKMAPCKYSALWTLANVGHFFFLKLKFLRRSKLRIFHLFSLEWGWCRIGLITHRSLRPIWVYWRSMEKKTTPCISKKVIWSSWNVCVLR